MEQKKTTGSGSTFHEWEDDKWRGNEPPDTSPQPRLQPPDHEVPDHQMPRLDANDVWLYQRRLEHTLRCALPGTMANRSLAMLRVLAARARICHELEKESGHFIGTDL